MSPRAMSRVALMAALMAVMSQISIPTQPVPFTLQTTAVMLCGFLLGARHGALALLVYLLLGAVGVPVFANFGSGPGTLLGPTGGYLLSFPLAAAVAGLAAPALARSRRWVALVSGVSSGALGLALIYAVGALWLAVQANLGPGAAIATGIIPFVPGGLAEVALAAALATAVAPKIAYSRLFSGTSRRSEGRVS